VILGPDEEELEAIVTEQVATKKALHQLRILRAYENVPFKGRGTTRNLLEYLSRGNPKAAHGAALGADIAASERRLEVLDDLYADFQARHEAHMEANTVPAPNPRYSGGEV